MKSSVTSSPFPAQGEVAARHYVTGRPVSVCWDQGRLRSITPIASGPEDLWIAPGLVDLQINGYGGIDFQQDGLTLEDLLTATRRLGQDGCLRYLLTLVTDDWPSMLARLRHYRDLRARSPELTRAIAGWHVEGPFLSPRRGFCGAHDPARMLDPEPTHVVQLRQLVGQDPLLLTLAPERANALACIRAAAQAGFKVSLGHTDAPAAVLQEAVRSGAVGFTHLGNGCPQELDRHDNILWRVLETPGLTVSLIPDMIHVSPALFRLIHRQLGMEAVYYTVDAMAAAGMPPGRYRMGRLELEVGADRVVRLPGSPNFAGSALPPFEGVLRAARMLGRSWREVWDRSSLAPARLMGIPAELEAGAAANFCLVTAAPEGEPALANPNEHAERFR